MALPEKLLKIIVCPKCKGELVYLEQECKLKCESCRLLYRVEGDIPVLLLDEAESFDKGEKQ